MIKELHLKNFRCFDNHRMSFRSMTIIVGQNNAGKSTIVEALRLISLVTTRYQGLNFSNVPGWLEIPKVMRGVKPSLKGITINFDSIFHRYDRPPAIIEAKFETHETVKIYIGGKKQHVGLYTGDKEKIHGVILDAQGKPITTKGQARKIHIPRIGILPQIGPLDQEEDIKTSPHVRGAMSSSLSSLNFRNQLRLHYDLFKDFKRAAESSWNGLRIRAFDGKDGQIGERLSLLIQDNDFTAEVGWMGHGLQMWLQTIWFLTYARDYETVILDEPDVYMHADLQRKLIRLLQDRHQQVIVATHSIEIMEEVEASDVLIVDRRRKRFVFANSLPIVQSVIDHIGGMHNIQLARLWNSRRLILVEGKDMKLLKRFQDTLFPGSEEPFETIPNMDIKGWSGWHYGIGSSMLLQNATGESIVTYCIFDSDYHTHEEIQKRLEEAQKRGIQLHIWRKKEIENYLLVPSAIQRVISSRIRSSRKCPDTREITEQINQIADNLKDETFDKLSDAIRAQNRAESEKANPKTREIIEAAWQTEEDRLAIISGKDALSLLSRWSQDTYSVSFSKFAIAQELRVDEIDQEVQMVVEAIEKILPFSSNYQQEE